MVRPLSDPRRAINRKTQWLLVSSLPAPHRRSGGLVPNDAVLPTELHRQRTELLGLLTVDTVARVLKDLQPAVGKASGHENRAARSPRDGVLSTGHYKGGADYLR